MTRFITAFVKTVRYALCIGGYALLGITVYSMYTAKQSIFEDIVDGTVIRPLLYLAVIILGAGLLGGALRIVKEAMRSRGVPGY
jgi:hypothetical protein